MGPACQIRLPRAQRPRRVPVISGGLPNRARPPKIPGAPPFKPPCDPPAPIHPTRRPANPSSARLALLRRAEPLLRRGLAAPPHPGPPLAAPQHRQGPVTLLEASAPRLRHAPCRDFDPKPSPVSPCAAAILPPQRALDLPNLWILFTAHPRVDQWDFVDRRSTPPSGPRAPPATTARTSSPTALRRSSLQFEPPVSQIPFLSLFCAKPW